MCKRVIVEIRFLSFPLANFYPGQTDVSDVGLQNVTRYTSHLSWFSAPYFSGFEDNVSSVVLPDSGEDYSSLVSDVV